MATPRTVVRAVLLILASTLALAGCSGDASPRANPPATVPLSASPEPPEEPRPTPSPDPAPDPEPEDPFPHRPLNVLLLGLDDRDPDALAGRPDTIILAHLPQDRQNAYLISFTRDSWVHIPGYGHGKLNSALPRGGLDTMHATLDELLGGLDLDATIQTNMHGFTDLVRWVGPFEVDNQYASSVGDTDFPEGRITLDETTALDYVRQRQGMPLGDLDRTERGRAALVGMLEQIQERLTEEPEAFPELIDMLSQHVDITGDVDLTDAIALGTALQDFDADSVVSLMAPVTGFGTEQGQSVNVVDQEQTAALGEALRTDSMDEYVDTYGAQYAPW
ncbi:LCP family protein [Pseudactinotalea sp. Z1748]|uniref:LCP family protein n=1 Tax=Pseudactinotalea sp. Z1748 TaxID=3413027 RepID=UPI003C7D9C9E